MDNATLIMVLLSIIGAGVLVVVGLLIDLGKKVNGISEKLVNVDTRLNESEKKVDKHEKVIDFIREKFVTKT
jgi:hypothetical protein